MWAYINLLVSVVALNGAVNRCFLSAGIVFSFAIICLFQLLDLVPSGLYSFAFGSVVYSLPCIIAFNLKFTKNRAFMALFPFLLLLLEVVAAYLWFIDSYGAVGVFYNDLAMILYVLIIISCMWGENGKSYKRTHIFGNISTSLMDFWKTDSMGYKGDKA